MRNSKKINAPIEFCNFIDNIAGQIAYDRGTPKNKTQAMRLIARDFNGKLVFKKDKFDFRII